MLDGVCEPCDAGFYQDEEGQTSCKPCPLGQSTHESGASSERYCTGEIYNYVLLGSICYMEFVSPVMQAFIRTRRDRLPVNLVPWDNQLRSLVPVQRGIVQVRYMQWLS